MQTKDLFAGCVVAITPEGDGLVVLLLTNDRTTIFAKTYHDVDEAMDAVHQWMLMLVDETEIHPSIVRFIEQMRKNVARHAIGDDVVPPPNLPEFIHRDELRTWFEREMGKSRGEEEA